MKSEQFDFRWRYQPRNQTDVQLMEYIQANRITSKNEMMLLAMRSFWLLHAIVADSKEKEQVQPVARKCVQALRKQAQEILEVAGIEDTSLAIWTQFSVNSPLHITTSRASHSGLDELSTCAGNNAYDDGGLSNFL
jgi:hypothetical protein